MDNKLSTIELDVNLEEYFMWNELARAEGILLDNWIAMILEKKMKELEKRG